MHRCLLFAFAMKASSKQDRRCESSGGLRGVAGELEFRGR